MVFCGCVEFFDVGGGIGFGVVELLGLFDGFGEVGIGGVYLVEYVVCCVVDDVEYVLDLVIC